MRQVTKMKMAKSFPLIMPITIIWCCLWKPSKSNEQGYDTADCIRWCGNTSIPHPFGFGPTHCYSDPNFAVTCKVSSSSQSQKPILKKFNLEIVEIKPFNFIKEETGQLIVKIPPLIACDSNSESSYNFTDSPFTLPLDGNEGNVFVSVGCDGYALLYNETGRIIAGCTSVCSANPPVAVANRTKCYGYHCCQAASYGLNLRLEKYRIRVTTNNTPGNCRSAFLIGKKYFEGGALFAPGITAQPIILQWGNSQPSLDNGNYDVGSAVFIIILSIGSCILTCYCVWQCWCCKTRKRRSEIKLKKKYFKGRLQEQRFHHQEAEKTKLFTEKELKKATENFNGDRIIGKGGQGTVYKGMLSDGKLIAVKKSTSLNETQWKEFINEVIILSNINHRNVVKLLGCCLETKSQLLVYEFIPNGTLSDLIHSPNEESLLTWNTRLRISSEVAGAIAYLHSSCATPIYHRDIKTSNVLLDHKYIAKVCDFGISRSIGIDQTHLTTCVRGTFGYLDPQYFRSRQFSEKSDVYSFGVVLVELLTGRKPISMNSDYATSLAVQFMSLNDDVALYQMLDPVILAGNKGLTEDIMVVVNLAKRCLNPLGTGRPTMMQVAMELACLNQKLVAKSASPKDN